MSVGQYLKLWHFDEWCRSWCTLEFDCRVSHAGQVIMSNCLVAIGTSKSGEAACRLIDGVVCIFIVRNKIRPGLIKSSSPGVVFEFLVGLNISPTTGRELGSNAIFNIMMWLICVSGWQNVFLSRSDRFMKKVHCAYLVIGCVCLITLHLALDLLHAIVALQ